MKDKEESKDYCNYGDGLISRKGVLYMRYYNPATRKGLMKAIDFPCNREGIRQAKKYRKQFINNINNNPLAHKIPVDKFIRFSEGFNLYISKNKFSSKSLSIMQYAKNYFLTACGDKIINQYTLYDYDMFVYYLENERKLSITTIGMYSRHLKAVFNTFKRWKLITDNPVDKIKTAQKAIKAIPDQDMASILMQLKSHEKYPHWYDLIYFLYLSGLRIGESINMTWEMIDLQNNVMVINNTKARRVDKVPILKDLKVHLTNMNPAGVNTGKLFNFSRTDSTKFFYKIQDELWGADQTKKRYTLHQLRKTFITYLLKNGNSIHDVMILSRHTDFRVIQKHYDDIGLQLPSLKETIDNSTSFLNVNKL
jgi:integrase